MHQAGFDVFIILPGQIAKTMHQGIYQGAGVVAIARMHHHACLLIDYNKVVVFKHHINGDILWDEFYFAGWVGHYDTDHIAGLNLVIGLNGLIVCQDIACLGGHLHLVAAGVLYARGHVLVDTQQSLPAVNHKAVMLVQLLLFAFFFGAFQFRKVFFVHHYGDVFTGQ